MCSNRIGIKLVSVVWRQEEKIVYTQQNRSYVVRTRNEEKMETLCRSFVFLLLNMLHISLTTERDQMLCRRHTVSPMKS